MRPDKINESIWKLWVKYFNNESDVLAPLLYDEIKESAFVFVGCNPSFFPNEMGKYLKKYEGLKKIELIDFFTWSNAKINKRNFMNISGQIDVIMRRDYKKYFGIYDDIGKKLKLEVQGLDMFLYREGTQNNVKSLLFKSEDYSDFNDFNDFANDQMNLFIDILNSINPKVILIANAYVSDIFKYKYGKSLTKVADEDFQRYNEIPIFFSSMLSGAHQLDKHSRERLIWQMKSSMK